MNRVQVYEEYVELMRKKGEALVTYACPDCSETLHSRQPDELQEPFDTAVQCPYCEQHHFRVVWASGLCEVNSGDGLGFREADTPAAREVPR